MKRSIFWGWWKMQRLSGTKTQHRDTRTSLFVILTSFFSECDPEFVGLLIVLWDKLMWLQKDRPLLKLCACLVLCTVVLNYLDSGVGILSEAQEHFSLNLHLKSRQPGMEMITHRYQQTNKNKFKSWNNWEKTWLNYGWLTEKQDATTEWLPFSDWSVFNPLDARFAHNVCNRLWQVSPTRHLGATTSSQGPFKMPLTLKIAA